MNYLSLSLEMVASIAEWIELIGVWFACVWGLVLSSSGYASLLWQTKRRKSPAPPIVIKPDALLSIIIAGYNEASYLPRLFQRINAAAKDPSTVEIIFVNPSSTDDTENVLRSIQSHIPYRVIQSQSGRGVALDTGTQHALGDLFLYLHADMQLPQNYDALIRQELLCPRKRVIATAFTFCVNRHELPEGRLVGLATMEAFANVRAHYFQLPYGDQGLALSRVAYLEAGGFPHVPMMEDLALVTKLRARAVAENQVISIMRAQSPCSPRRWIHHGVLKNTLLNQGFVMAYRYFGWSPEKIHSYYYRTTNVNDQSNSVT